MGDETKYKERYDYEKQQFGHNYVRLDKDQFEDLINSAHDLRNYAQAILGSINGQVVNAIKAGVAEVVEAIGQGGNDVVFQEQVIKKLDLIIAKLDKLDMAQASIDAATAELKTEVDALDAADEPK